MPVQALAAMEGIALGAPHHAVWAVANDTSSVELSVPAGAHVTWRVSCIDPLDLTQRWANHTVNATLGGEVVARCEGKLRERVACLTPII